MIRKEGGTKAKDTEGKYGTKWRRMGRKGRFMQGKKETCKERMRYREERGRKERRM